MSRRLATASWWLLAAAGGAQAEAPRAPVLAAGTELRIQLLEPLGTSLDLVGETWHATVLDNVRTPDGRIIVPAGATLSGTITVVRWGPCGRLALDTDTIQTRFGISPIAAQLESAAPVPYVRSFSVYGGAIHADRCGSDVDDIFVPAATTLVLRLTRPLVP